MASTQHTAPATVTGESTIRAIGDRLLIPLPEEASAQLPSRGQVAVTGTIGSQEVELVIEPDGRRGHWLPLDPGLQRALHAAEGHAVAFSLTPTKAWPEPDVPADLEAALIDAPDLEDTWAGITPMARWEWVRWVQSTKNPDTRARRVEVSIDKMRGGKRRPCCFDLSSCTDPEVAKGGKLVEP